MTFYPCPASLLRKHAFFHCSPMLMNRTLCARCFSSSCPHRLVVRTSRRGRDNPGSTPGVDMRMRTDPCALLAQLRLVGAGERAARRSAALPASRATRCLTCIRVQPPHLARRVGQNAACVCVATRARMRATGRERVRGAGAGRARRQRRNTKRQNKWPRRTPDEPL